MNIFDNLLLNSLILANIFLSVYFNLQDWKAIDDARDQNL